MAVAVQPTAEKNDGEGDETADGDDSEGSCYQTSYKCLTAAGRPLSSAPGSSDSDDEVADEMGSESDSEPRWSDSWDLSRAIAYGVLAALNRSPESFHLSSLSSSSPISSATSSPSSSALPVADEGGLPAAVRPSRQLWFVSRQSWFVSCQSWFVSRQSWFVSR